MSPPSEKEKVELKQRLARVLRVSGNKTCSDCPETRPAWISFIKPQQQFALGSKVLACFVCSECAALHRKLGTHICNVRSITHDQFEEKDVECVEYSGNDVVNEIFEGHLQKSTMDGINIKPILGTDNSRRERFIRQKYVDLYFYRKRAHYQHISDVNQMKPMKSSGSMALKTKPSPTQPFRKKLKAFLGEDNSVNDKTQACSTTVGNTTNTTRTRTLTDRDDSHRSETPIRKTRKPRKKRSSSNGLKKGQKKSSSQRKLKLEDPMFGMPFHEMGESSVPQKQPSLRNLKEQGPAHLQTNNKKSDRGERDRGREDLSGMILVFDEDSYDSLDLHLDSPEQQRRSLRDLERYRENGTTSVPHRKKPTVDSHKIQQSAPSRRKPTVESHQIHNEFLDEFDRNPLVEVAGKSCESKSRNDIPSSRREESLASGNKGKTPVTNQSVSAIATIPLATHISKDITPMKLTNPYLKQSSELPNSMEGFISEVISEEEDTSYGFGDNTINNMSGTGDDNEISITEYTASTLNGFRVIEPASVCENTSNNKTGFTKKFKPKKEIDCDIKQKSVRSLTDTNRSNLTDSNRSSTSIFQITKSNANIFEKVFLRLSHRSNLSAGITKSSRSMSTTSNMSASYDEPTSSKQLQESPEFIVCESPVSEKKKKKKKKSSRNISSKSNTSLSVDKPSKRKKSSKSSKSLKQMDCESPNSTKKKKKKRSSRNITSGSNKSLIVDESPKQKKKSSKSKVQELLDCETPLTKKKKSSKPRSKKEMDCDSPLSTKKKKSSKPRSKKEMDCDSPLSAKKKKKKKSSKPRSQKQIDCDTPVATKKRSSKKLVTVESEESTSKTTIKDEERQLRTKALLEEWKKLREENQREFDKMRDANEKRFASFDNHYTQHIRV